VITRFAQSSQGQQWRYLGLELPRKGHFEGQDLLADTKEMAVGLLKLMQSAMAGVAQCDQAQLGIISTLCTRADMMYGELLTLTTMLATPIVALEHLTAEL